MLHWCFPPKENFDTAREVLAAVPQPQPTLETVIITLLQIAIYSEEVEFGDICSAFSFI